MNVAKFGGSSLATAKRILSAITIVAANNYQALIVSAPGKAFADDVKVTDLLLSWSQDPSNNDLREKIALRYRKIITKLGTKLEFNLDEELSAIQNQLTNENCQDYALSRGEYLCAKIIAEATGRLFVDPTKYITIYKDGRYDCDAEMLKRDIDTDMVVVPGFYGRSPKGNVRTFSRGGSDISGAIIAAALAANEYHNWTDVSGVFTADPRVISAAFKINTVLYREVRELGNLGTTVFHPDAIRPVRLAGIPTIIKNTADPDNPGTKLVNAIPFNESARSVVTGIAKTDGFVEIRIEYLGMGDVTGYTKNILKVLKKHDVSYAIKPESKDSMSLILIESQFSGKLEVVLNDIRKKVPCDKLSVNFDLSLISVVGANMKSRPGISARLFQVLADAGISVIASTQGGSEISITVVVNSDASNRALNVLHNAFFVNTSG